MSKNIKFIAIGDDRLWKSFLRDLVSSLSLIFVVLVGVYVQSNALQWIGGVFWIIWLLSSVSGFSSGHMTIEEARKLLDEMEAQNG